MWHAELFPSVVLTVDLPVEFVLEDNHNRQIQRERWWEDDLPVLDSSSNSGDVTSASIAKIALLPRILHCFETVLQRYQPLFDELDDIDTHFWILEPSLPARRSNVERRIALWEGGASLVIALDPDNPRGTPVLVRFLGVTLATMKAAAASGCGQGMIRFGETTAGDIVDWRTSFSDFVSEEEDGGEGIDVKKNSQSKAYTVLDQKRSDHHKSTTTSKMRWSKERSIRENLELWFGSPLPSPLSSSVTEKSDFLVECAVCYTHRLPTEDSNCDDGPLPEVKCGNPSCSRHYHESCLFEWLHSLPTARVSFDRIFGSCMYCSQGISVKILNGQV
jgi:E3 ubiquitin-protein ligase FANCL